MIKTGKKKQKHFADYINVCIRIQETIELDNTAGLLDTRSIYNC